MRSSVWTRRIIERILAVSLMIVTDKEPNARRQRCAGAVPALGRPLHAKVERRVKITRARPREVGLGFTIQEESS